MQQIGENIIGSDLPKFIYADDNYVEFYDYHGIYIYDIQNLNSIRSKLIDIYNTGIKKEESAKWYVAYIWEHLNNSGVFQRYKDSLYKLEKISNEFDISNLDKEKQVWEKICEIFNSISKVYKEKMTFDVFVQVFKLQIKDTYVKTLPPVLDSVNLLDINLSNGKESKNAFFIGVNEGSFPKISEEDILFNDEQLKEAGVPAGLIRISCGLEDKNDLIADISAALDTI